ncbi:PREDICTED: beta-defensin 118 [Propithecus coquereli]|uniref:Beta-defensin n=1 Tax=Propithecus coquereli TaxID=379532 RepID=A0A2K6EHK5_PROCO|nr:PREDICTED: beta-defensin 118 [Propithecus coquereli]
MRLLLLALPILALLPQVIPAYGGEKKCWNKSGHCRKQCKDEEAMKEMCTNHRVCCIPDSKRHWQVPETPPTRSYDLTSVPFGVILTLVSTTHHVEVKSEKVTVKQSEVVHTTEISRPESFITAQSDEPDQS